MTRTHLVSLLLCATTMASTTYVVQAQSPRPTFTTLYNFPATGGNPEAPVIIGATGVLYGTFTYSSSGHPGGVFALAPPQSQGQRWRAKVLHLFGNKLGLPITPLVMGEHGVLYGATYDKAGIFALTPPASPAGQWAEDILYQFPSYCCIDRSPLAIGPSGILYDMISNTYNQGSSLGSVLFALLPPGPGGGAWRQKPIYAFGNELSSPTVTVVAGPDGVLYGITQGSETANCGTVYSLRPPAAPDGTWTGTVLHKFQGGADGCVGTGYKSWSPVIGDNGVLYGATPLGGTSNTGVIYSLTPPATPGGSWAEALLFDFPSQTGPSPLNPGPLALSIDGTLYGVTENGGPLSGGTIFALKPPATTQGVWTNILLHAFTGSDGAGPTGVAIGGNGVLYGATYSGGAYNYGTIFALTP